MKTIHYLIRYSDVGFVNEVVSVKARSINSGYAKALKLAREPLGNGTVREIASVEFWMIV